MNCTACTAAEADPRIDRWGRGCLSCDARALACLGTLPDDTEAMRRMFGPRLAEGRALFQRWAGALRRFLASNRGAPT